MPRWTRCAHCTKRIRPKNPQRIYCSRACRRDASILRSLNGAPVVKRQCPVCQSAFKVGISPHQRYCSEVCRYEVAKERQRAYEKKKSHKKARFAF